LAEAGEAERGKNRAPKGAILVMSERIARAPGALGGKNVSQCQQPARETYNGAVFEFKKEIPVYTRSMYYRYGKLSWWRPFGVTSTRDSTWNPCA
jgi:hypothetical protein